MLDIQNWLEGCLNVIDTAIDKYDKILEEYFSDPDYDFDFDDEDELPFN